MVRISAPSCMTASVRQELTRLPSISTVQAPHSPRPQPYFGPFRVRSLRNTSSSEVAGGAATRATLPLTFRPIGSAAELAAALSSMSWPHDPIRYELMLAALVEHAHRDREGTAEALRPWRNERWGSFEHSYPLWADPSTCYHPYSLLSLCALAVVSPSDSAVLSRQISDYLARNPPL